MKKIISVLLALVMVIFCALPAFASRISQGNAKQLVADQIWVQSEDMSFAFEDTEDLMAVTVINNGVKFIFTVSGMPAKAKLISYEVVGDIDILTIVNLLNGVVLKLISNF